jgi:hypothetical protein
VPSLPTTIPDPKAEPEHRERNGQNYSFQQKRICKPNRHRQWTVWKNRHAERAGLFRSMSIGGQKDDQSDCDIATKVLKPTTMKSATGIVVATVTNVTNERGSILFRRLEKRTPPSPAGLSEVDRISG